MPEKQIDFQELKISKHYGEQVKRVFYPVENDRSKMMEQFWELDDDARASIIVLISNMATNKDYKNPGIKYRLTGYKYGEIRPFGHRFFFFQVIEDNIIFFHYEPKKSDSLGAKKYKEINERMEKYEQAFREQMG